MSNKPPRLFFRDANMSSCRDSMQYVRRGGSSGRLFMLKPHDRVHCARLLGECGLK